MTSTTERPVLLCDECGTHYGNPEKTALAHDTMMTAYRDANARAMERLDDRRTAALGLLADSQARVDDLTATIASDYSRQLGTDARVIVERSVVAESAARESTASKARDRAMSVVARVDELHHENGSDCSCGIRITQCAGFAALAPFLSELRRWQARHKAS